MIRVRNLHRKYNIKIKIILMYSKLFFYSVCIYLTGYVFIFERNEIVCAIKMTTICEIVFEKKKLKMRRTKHYSFLMELCGGCISSACPTWWKSRKRKKNCMIFIGTIRLITIKLTFSNVLQSKKIVQWNIFLRTQSSLVDSLVKC